jgi:hypothetical protein
MRQKHCVREETTSRVQALPAPPGAPTKEFPSSSGSLKFVAMMNLSSSQVVQQDELHRRLSKAQLFFDKLLSTTLHGQTEALFMQSLEDGDFLRQVAMKLDRCGVCEISPPTDCSQTLKNIDM